MTNVSEQDASHFCGEHLTPKIARWHSRIDRMGIEKCHFLCHGLLDRDLILNVLLCSVLDAYKTQTKLNLLVHDHSFGVCASVHDIDLCDHTNGSDTLRIYPASQSRPSCVAISALAGTTQRMIVL